MNQMVADFVAGELQEPECVFSMNCEDDEIKEYKDKYENISYKVQEEMKRINNMRGWWE